MHVEIRWKDVSHIRWYNLRTRRNKICVHVRARAQSQVRDIKWERTQHGGTMLWWVFKREELASAYLNSCMRPIFFSFFSKIHSSPFFFLILESISVGFSLIHHRHCLNCTHNNMINFVHLHCTASFHDHVLQVNPSISSECVPWKFHFIHLHFVWQWERKIKDSWFFCSSSLY